MSLPRKMTINCSKCGKPMTATVFDSVNSDYAPDIATQITSGKLFDVECPHCKFVSHLEYDFLYHDIKNSAMIWVVHKNSPNYINKISEIRATPKLPHKTLRIVEDMNALKEKVSCLEHKRDDRIIELCKVFTMLNLLSQKPNFDFRNAFYTVISGRDMIYLYDHDNDEMCCELPSQAYEHLGERYFNSPYAEQFDSNYAIVDYAWAEEILAALLQAEHSRIDTAEESSDTGTDEPASAKVICAKCNSELPEDSEFCQYCGSKIIAVSEQPEVRETPVAPVAPDDAKPQKPESLTHQPTNYGIDDELGLAPNKPIRTNGAEQQRLYLQRLRSINGDVLTWNRRGSVSIDGVQGLVDIFDAYLPSGAEYKTVYLNTNGIACPSYAPKGFSYVIVPYVSSPVSQPTKTNKPSNSKKTAKILLAIIAIVAVLAICIILAIPEIKYQKACSALKGNSFDSAIEMFESLDGYKDSESKISEAMYGYVLKHKNNDDITTFDYLKKLKKQDYKDSARIYSDLYEWEITVIAVNSSQADETTHKSSISKYQSVYFHMLLTGGEPHTSTRILVKSIFPDGTTNEFTFDDKWEDGSYLWYGWDDSIYTYPADGETGTLQCKYYDDDGNLIGMGSVRITN